MFRTELTIAPQERLLPRTARVLTVGSCFADSIGERLRLNKVQTLVNPFGTVFQPLALAKLLRAAAGEDQDWQQHVVEARGRWQSYDFHSIIGAESPVELLQSIQETVRRVGEFVRTANTVVLTLGTAWAYRLRETGELVSNLHKLPAGLFEKELLTADEIVNSLAEVHALLRRINPEVHIVLTVSPVRHIKDTLPLNAVSKSVLRVACHYLSELLPNVSYFPAYELLTDDLRDYRFYAADMLHPSDVAEDYIWERFARVYFDADFGRFRKEWAAVRQSLGHRPLHPGAPEHRVFLDQTRERLERLASQGVDVRQELRDVQRQLAALPPPRPVRVPEVEPEDDEERIDIGEGMEEATAGTTIPTPSTRPDSRRPERDRRNNDRRDDRRPQRNKPDQPAPIAAPAQEEVATAASQLETPVAADADVLLLQPEVPQPEAKLPALEGTTDYPAKKKKRRSRGGAKRTARKHAARLAAEQEITQQVTLPGEEPAIEPLLEEIEVVLDTPNIDVPTTNSTLPVEPATEADASGPVLAEVESEVLPDLADTTSDEPTEHELLTDTEAAPTAAQPTSVRKRGTGPTPKKSKVITKSGLVKRGKRTSLYRSPTAEPVAETATEPVSEPVAPLISAPIIPEVLLERPAVEPATLPNEPVAEATSTPQPTPTAPAEVPAKPKRGRPKAAMPMPASPAEEASTSGPTAATPESASPTEAPAKPRATRTKAAPAKKATAKPATPRRGRPPGKKNPPPAPETPTT